MLVVNPINVDKIMNTIFKSSTNKYSLVSFPFTRRTSEKRKVKPDAVVLIRADIL